MRLFELLNEAPPTIKRSYGAMPQKPLVLPLGAGAYAEVMGHDDNPHQVMKLSRRQIHSSGKDGYDYFIIALAESDMHDNPYFPRIESMRTITDKYDNTGYQVRMERLTSIKELTEEQAESIVRKSLTPDYIKQQITRQQKNTGGWLWLRILQEWLYHVSDYSIRVPADFLRTVADEDLQQALLFANKLAEDGGYILDLQPFNFMARQSPYGTQLVITDPLGSKRYS
jgi:hypothetical protein